jgi:hypothetical protein
MMATRARIYEADNQTEIGRLLQEGIARLQRAPNAPVPARFPIVPCTCPSCASAASETDLPTMLANQANGISLDWNAMLGLRAQQYEEEDCLEGERVQNDAHALGLQRAICPWCKSVQSPNDGNALKREVDTTGATIEDECRICYNTREKISLRCCSYLQSICLECAKKQNFATPQHPHDPNAPPLPPDM